MTLETLDKSWRQSAAVGVALHQLRNRLQSILIEAAVLRLEAQLSDPSLPDRFRALVQGAEAQLENIARIVSRPSLAGVADVESALREADVRCVPNAGAAHVACAPEVLRSLVEVLLTEALPQRGFESHACSFELKSETVVLTWTLSSVPDSATAEGAAWPLLQQMVRDLSGTATLSVTEPPTLRLALPAAK